MRPISTYRSTDGTTYQLHDLDGNPVSLEDLRGSAVWVNFLATWCPPCQGETPILRELAEKYKDQGLEVVGVSVQETNADDVATYADRYYLDFTVGFDGSGTSSTSTASARCRPSSSSTRRRHSATSPRGRWSLECASQRVEAILPEPGARP